MHIENKKIVLITTFCYIKMMVFINLFWYIIEGSIVFTKTANKCEPLTLPNNTTSMLQCKTIATKQYKII